MLLQILLFFCIISICHAQQAEQPTLCLTFDDGSIDDAPGYTSERWNEMLLRRLREANVQAVFFVKGAAVDNAKGREVLKTWDAAGHLIANHTYSHWFFNSSKLTLNDFIADVVKNDSLIRGYSNYTKLFRFPYLKEGNTPEKRDGFRQFLKEHTYRNGYVTIDASDWYVNSRLLAALKKDSTADIAPYRDYYLQHIYDRALYYNDLSKKLTGRQIQHSLLLHHNPAAALFMGDLIAMFKEKGWNVVNASDAYKDEIYKNEPNILPAGESLIWAMAKESGKFENVLRYPAEDGSYQKAEMDSLGL
jgi:peptidoglycan/xylan/chitin deacetylase (PgdA/CDA1 family)